MDQVAPDIQQVIDLPRDEDCEGEVSTCSINNDDNDAPTDFESQAADFLHLFNLAAHMTPRALLSQALDIPPTPVIHHSDIMEKDSGLDTCSENNNTEETFHSPDVLNEAIVPSSMDSGNSEMLSDSFLPSLRNTKNSYEADLCTPDSPINTRIRISGRMKAPCDRNLNILSGGIQANSNQNQSTPTFRKMEKEIKRLKNQIRKLQSEVTEANEKVNRYMTQSTLTSYGIKLVKKSSGVGASPQLLKNVCQQVSNTFINPVIVRKKAREKESHESMNKPHLNADPSPEICTNPLVPEISDQTWTLLNLRNSQLSSQLSQGFE